jgi:flagellar hook-associated protein 2
MAGVSGIDTDSIVSQMMAVERRPQDLMKTKVASMQKAQTAWQSIADKLVALKTASDGLAALGAAANLRTVTSSTPAQVAARSIGSGTNGSSSIDVLRLATSHAMLGADTFTSPSDSIGTRTLTITKTGGSPVTITSTDGTLAGLAAAVNTADLGVSAKVLQTSPGVYQLSLTADTSGAAASFSATGTGWASLDVVRQGVDAQLRVDGVTITRSSNVINDVIDGVELTLQSLTASPVAITTSRDDAAISDKVKAIVTAINDLSNVIKSATKTGSKETDRGPLVGEFNARRLMDQVRDTIARSVTTAAGTTMTARDLGITLQRDGTAKFDQEALNASLRDHPAAVLAALGRTATSTAAGVTVSGLTSAATASNRSITVTQAASQAILVGQVSPPPPPGTQVTMNIVTPSGTFNVSFVTGSSFAETGANLNAALRASGVKMTATGAVDHLELRDDQFGPGRGFSVTGADAVGLIGAGVDGSDAAGTIEGTPFTANGRVLTSNGVIISVGTSAAQLATAGGSVSGTLTTANGLAGALANIGAQGQSSGPALASKASLQDQIDDLQQRIDHYSERLVLREQTLRRRFTAMEDLLSKLQGMTSSLPSQSTQA